jgi:glycosyltransferase involved in cell wall biosynthesis
MNQPIVTIISPTTGKSSLYKLIESIDKQSIPNVHILLWDDKREDDFLYPDSKTMEVQNPYSLNGTNRYSIVIPGLFVQGNAYGSSLRSLGLLAANTPYVTFADDDIYWEPNHLETMVGALESSKKEWCFCVRKIWSSDVEYLGEDHFESVGDSPERKVPYEMVDNNCMMFARRFGVSGACLYRNVETYNDDRLFYQFLKKYAGEPIRTNLATVNQICPKKLEEMFRIHCTK